MSQRAKCLSQTSFRSEVVRTQRDTHTHRTECCTWTTTEEAGNDGDDGYVACTRQRWKSNAFMSLKPSRFRFGGKSAEERRRRDQAESITMRSSRCYSSAVWRLVSADLAAGSASEHSRLMTTRPLIFSAAFGAGLVHPVCLSGAGSVVGRFTE